MKKVSFALMAAGMVFLASCGGGADDKAKAAADSARVADSLAAIAAKEAAAADSARLADSLAAAAKADSIAAAEAAASAKGGKGGKGGAAAPKKEEPKKTEPATNMKDAAKNGGSTGPKTMKDAATETKTSGGGAKSMKDLKGK